MYKENYANYGSSSQGPGPLPDNAYDRISGATVHSMSKTPNYVIVTAALTNTAGFFFGSSASYATKALAEGGTVLTGSSNYVSWGGEATLNEGDRLDIHPLAWSGSAADIGKIRFVYKGGLDGPGRP